MLESLALDGPDWATTDSFTDVPGHKVLDVARSGGLEGVVAKRRNGRYLPGRRSDDLDQGQADPDPGSGDRRVDAGQGQPGR